MAYFAMWRLFKWGKCTLNIGVIKIGTLFGVINLNIYMSRFFNA